jgi:predicted transcriptional regulator
MKRKTVKIGVRSIKGVLNDFVKTGNMIEAGKQVKGDKAIYFESIKGFRKALTPMRLELLHLIKEKNPKSIQGLARLAKRDIKSVSVDIKILESLNLIDLERKKVGRKEVTPRVEYDTIELSIAV